MSKYPKVHVLMATYNGEKHIKKQMDSILNQTYPCLEIFVRDDGSTDRTRELIAEYEKTTGRVHLLEDEEGNLKPPGTFYQMLKICPKADYYAFADQDDLWLPDKVARGVFYLLKEEGRLVDRKDDTGKIVGKMLNEEKGSDELIDLPMVYCSSYDYYTEDGKYIRKFPDQRNALTFNQCILNSPASAFTVMFNEAARVKFSPDHKGVKEMHDRRFVRSAIAMGKLLYDPVVTAHHIRYETSMTEGDSTILNLILTSVKNEIFGSDFLKQREELKDYLRQYEDMLSDKDRKTAELFASKNTPISWGRKLLYPKRLRTRVAGEIAMRMAILLGRV